MSKYLLIGALALAILLATGLAWSISKNSALKVEVSALTSTVSAMTLERDVAHLAQAAEAERARLAVIELVSLQENIEAILTGDFTHADATLDPALIAYFECLRNGNADGVHCGASPIGNPDPVPD